MHCNELDSGPIVVKDKHPTAIFHTGIILSQFHSILIWCLTLCSLLQDTVTQQETVQLTYFKNSYAPLWIEKRKRKSSYECFGTRGEVVNVYATSATTLDQGGPRVAG